MCLYPRIIQNRRYTPNKKNKGSPPQCGDKRMMAIPVGCGVCIECMRQKQHNWQVRLHEEIKQRNNGKFVTLTFSEESLDKLEKELKTEKANDIAGVAVRRFTERWRKTFKKPALRHWLVTELGHTGTERLHLHGIIFTDKPEEIERHWKYGNIWIGEYVGAKTINYIIKYVSKVDKDHVGYKSKVYASKGIGSGYIQKKNKHYNRYNGEKTIETYRLNNGGKVALPVYYRNKIYSEEQKMKLWTAKLDKEVRFVMGTEIKTDTKEGYEKYIRTLRYAQRENKRLGFGTSDWKAKEYLARRKEFDMEKEMLEMRTEFDI